MKQRSRTDDLKFKLQEIKDSVNQHLVDNFPLMEGIAAVDQ